MPRISPSLTAGGNLDVAVSSRAAIADYTAVRGALLDRLALLAAGGAGQLSAARAVALDQLLTGAALRSGTIAVPVSYPVLADGANPVSGGVAYTYGAWVIAVAAGVLGGHALTSITPHPGGVGISVVTQVGVGAPGAEVVIGTWSFLLSSAAGVALPAPVVPALLITANAAVSIRCATSPLVTQNVRHYLGFTPTPF